MGILARIIWEHFRTTGNDSHKVWEGIMAIPTYAESSSKDLRTN